MNARHVTIKKAAEITGYSIRAIETKIQRGQWLQGKVWIKGPDGRILIDLQGYEEWATGAAYSPHQEAA